MEEKVLRVSEQVKSQSILFLKAGEGEEASVQKLRSLTTAISLR